MRAAELNAAQQTALVALIAHFVDNTNEGHAKVKMEEVVAHLDETHFAWIGGMEDGSVFYFRVQSPVILIEFDQQKPINLRQFSKTPDLPTKDHIHIVVRTPNGNDYGKDLLRQHLLAQPH